MEVETSNKKTEPSDQSNMVIAIGKRKGESYGPAMSLQDVFSDSANLAGRQQKTLLPPEAGQKKMVATPRKGISKPSKNYGVGSRKMITESRLKVKISEQCSKGQINLIISYLALVRN
jgi:hypothetical protein